MAPEKRKILHTGQKNQSRKITKKAKLAIEGSFTEVVRHDVKELLSESLNGTTEAVSSSSSVYSPLEKFTEIDVKISKISSTGDGLGLSQDGNHVYVVPFSVPGDMVRAKLVNHFAQDNYTIADFIKVIEPSPKRDESRVKCPYFSSCSGCQFQMLSYKDQLAHKKSVIERAYKNFSNLPPELIPAIGDTFGSPLQYGYRTKLTPHFDGPPGRHSLKRGKEGQGVGYLEVPPIGFMMKGRRKVIDIEDCPIGTDAVREGMKAERVRVAKEINRYKKGATILLRESTKRIRPPSESSEVPHPLDSAQLPASATASSYEEEKTCITDQTAIATEYIDSFVFKNTAGAFFQNNNSSLPSFTAYIRENVLPPSHATQTPIRYLIDAYCGSGLFTITLSSIFSASIGIDISSASIEAAHNNAQANNIANATFMAADASALFEKVTYPSNETVVVIDPPRKGCDDNFLQQLLRYGPRRIVYVSCNVHTQARDVGVLVEGKEGCSYSLESLRGFDFFPQTSHVEGVAVLNRVEWDQKTESAETVKQEN
jgi:tRNA (uracil-5-)-methyltransferase